MTRGGRCTVYCMFGHPKMSAFRTSLLSYIPRSVSRAKTRRARTCASSRPSSCQLAAAGGQEAGCEPECHSLRSASRVHTGGRILLAQDSATLGSLAPKSEGRSRRTSCSVSLSAPGHVVRIHAEAVQPGQCRLRPLG